MKTFGNKNITFILINIILSILVIKICKITGFCFTIINLVSPLFFGYIISWIVRPLIEKLKMHKIKPVISIIIIYIIMILIFIAILLILLPKFTYEVKNIITGINELINNNPILKKIKKILLNNILLTNIISNIKIPLKNIVGVLSTIIYSLIISFFLSIKNIKIKKILVKYFPTKIITKINKNLRIFIKGTLIDMIVLFILTFLSFLIIKLPGSIIFASFIALTNIIPYIGPYIGGIPAVLIGFSVSYRIGFITLLIVITLQILESAFIQPYIMSKTLKLNPILIIMGLIIFGHFFGIVGMIFATPLVSIIKIFYDYYKNKPIKNWLNKVLDKP